MFNILGEGSLLTLGISRGLDGEVVLNNLNIKYWLACLEDWVEFEFSCTSFS